MLITYSSTLFIYWIDVDFGGNLSELVDFLVVYISSCHIVDGIVESMNDDYVKPSSLWGYTMTALGLQRFL